MPSRHMKAKQVWFAVSGGYVGGKRWYDHVFKRGPIHATRLINITLSSLLVGFTS